MRNPWNTDSEDVPAIQTGQSSRLTSVAVVLWGLVFASIAVFYMAGTDIFEIAGVFQFGLRSIGIGVVTLAFLALLVKVLRYVGMGMKLIVRLFVFGLFLIGLTLGTGVI